MATQSEPLFIKFLSQIAHFLNKLKAKIKAIPEYLNPFVLPADVWPPIDEMTLAPIENIEPEDPKSEKTSLPAVKSNPSENQPISKANKHWVLAERTDSDNKNRVVLVEVEFFPHDTKAADPKKPRILSYTAEGEDPNLRITHFPPSSQIH